MELTPQSIRSPPSPVPYTSNPQPLYEYPSPAQSDSRFKSTESLPRLELYSCPVSGSGVEVSDSHLRSSPSTPNNLSSEYDPFSPYHPAVSSAYTHDIYGAQPAEVTILPASPGPSGTTSQRSSFSAAPASKIFTQGESVTSYAPSIKMEGHSEYVPVTESMLMGSPQLDQGLLTSASSYPGSLETTFYQDSGWSKIEYTAQDQLPSISTLPIPLYDRRSESQERSPAGSLDQRRGPVRTRTRKLTTKEDANFQCHVKGCGKLFGRSYNFKAHMETHDAGREYPFPCPLKDCTKKFVRKTDLQRHHQSVHMKQRNHRCDYCSRYFARKDTLRRHMEDGCSKRFDIETVDFRPSAYTVSDQMATRLASEEQQIKHAAYGSSGSHNSSSGIPSAQASHDVNLMSASGAYLHRQDYMTGVVNEDPVWTH